MIAVRPGSNWRWGRRLTQVLALFTIAVAPFLGGWQRLDRNLMSGWDGRGWDLPTPLMTRLPLGDAPSKAYDASVMLGGGSAVEYLGVPIVDPVGGSLALAGTAEVTLGILIAWSLPILLGLLAGRVFCGWFCPFGVLSRTIDWLSQRVAPSVARPQLPRKRWLRFALLAAAVVAGALGTQVFLYLVLPHALLQQAVYSVWLMGGGGAALGALLGLLAVGLVFGPTTYCATVCPTGAALSALGRGRVVRLNVVSLAQCGARCDLCDRECWIGLHPSEGDPGPDCDLCGRCTEVCPRDNMHVRLGRRVASTSLGALLLVSTLSLASSGCTSEPWSQRPALTLEQAVRVDGVDVFVSAVDNTGVRRDADALAESKGSELAVSLIRGPRGEPDRLGKLPGREFYSGPLTLRLVGDDGVRLDERNLERPNFPQSGAMRTIYHAQLDRGVRPGQRVQIAPIDGWLTDGLDVGVPDPNVGSDPSRLLWHVGVAFLGFGGLVLLSLIRIGESGPGPRETGPTAEPHAASKA